MGTRNLFFGQKVDIPGNEIDELLSITNLTENEEGAYGICIGNNSPSQHNIDPGTSDNYDIPEGEGVQVYNARQAELEVDW